VRNSGTGGTKPCPENSHPHKDGIGRTLTLKPRFVGLRNLKLSEQDLVELDRLFSSSEIVTPRGQMYLPGLNRREK